MQGEASFSTTASRDERGDTSAESDVWRVLVQSERLSDFAPAWITLLCQSAVGVRRSALLLGTPDRGPFDVFALPRRPSRWTTASCRNAPMC